MREREFIETLNLLAETEKAPDLSAKIMRRARRKKFFRILAKSALTFPVMFLISLESVKLISGTGIPKLVFAFVPIPKLFLWNPALSILAYVIATSIYASMLVSTYLEGGDINGALLLSPGKRSGGGVFEVRETAL